MGSLEGMAETLKQAEGEEAVTATDELSAELQTEEGIRKLVKATGEDLSTSRYRSPPDQEYKTLQELSTRFNILRNLVARKSAAPPSNSSTSNNSAASDVGPRSLKVEQYITGVFTGEGEKAKRAFATWRREWKEAETALKARKATAADFFNRLQPALGGRALQMAQEFGDRQDPYSEAMQRLHKVFGDEVELALEHVKPVHDVEKALDAAENAWGRFKDQEATLEQRGLTLQDLLWHQVALRILPDTLEPQKRWDAWVEDQRKAFNQAQASRPESAIKKGKKAPSNNEGSPASQTFRFPAKAEIRKIQDAGDPPVVANYLKRKNTYTYHDTHLSLPEFHQAQCFKLEEVTRFFKETAEELRASSSFSKAPTFTVAEKKGCIKCGDEADHDTDSCRKLAGMGAEAWPLRRRERPEKPRRRDKVPRSSRRRLMANRPIIVMPERRKI